MSAENVEIARSAYAAFNRRGVEAILDFLTPDIEWRTWARFARTTHVEHGHEGVRRVLAVYEENLSDLQAEPSEFIDAGEQVVVPVTLRGKSKGSEEPFELELVHVWTVAPDHPGLARKLDVYESREEALDSVGLSTS